MGLLDDAIREHLELKRLRGTDPTEIARAEREALGPVRRAVDPTAETGPEAPGDLAPEPEDHPEGDPYAEGGRHGADVSMPAADAHQEPVDQSGGVIRQEAEDWLEPESTQPPLHDLHEPEPASIDEHATQVYRPPPADEPASPAPAPASAPPISDESADAGHEPTPPPAEHLGAQPSEQPAAPPESAHDGPRDAPDLTPEKPEAEGGEDDVLEETPDFLQETPEHERLWFEQRPPRDFDFDK